MIHPAWASAIVGAGEDPRAPWTRPSIDASRAIRGIHSVQLHVSQPALTSALLTGMMDFTVIGKEGGTIRLAAGKGMPGQVVEIVNAADAPRAVNGLGTVHHVAFAVSTGEEQLQMREALVPPDST